MSSLLRTISPVPAFNMTSSFQSSNATTPSSLSWILVRASTNLAVSATATTLPSTEAMTDIDPRRKWPKERSKYARLRRRKNLNRDETQHQNKRRIEFESVLDLISIFSTTRPGKNEAKYNAWTFDVRSSSISSSINRHQI